MDKMKTKTIDTLVDDILTLIDKGGEVSDELVQEFASGLAQTIKERLSEGEKKPYLRLSNLGTKCDRKLWLEIKHPELVEPLSPETKMKFLIGDIHEAVLLFLAAASGHEVKGQQDKLSLEGVVGHRDAVVDGMLLDVKSASSRSFVKFKEGLKIDDDAFGYIVQLGSYLTGGQDDPDMTIKDEAAFLASDKTLGKITLDRHKYSSETRDSLRKLSLDKQEMLRSEEIPERGYSDEPMGKSGNRKLGVNCSYCPVKHSCWPNLRTFIYSSGPVYLTHVERQPDVPEVGTDDPF